MITTFTLNPCIDRMLYIEGFRENHVNRVSTVKTYAGGKGINVSRVLKLLGSDTYTSGIVAGENGSFIEKLLIKDNLKVDFLNVDGETRINTKIYDTLNSKTTDLNEPGPIISQSAAAGLVDKAKKLSKAANTVVYSGSLPPGLKPDIYRRLVEISIDAGCNVILDCDSANLQEGIKGRPTLIKPNLHELEVLFGKELGSQETLKNAVRQLLSEGIKYVAVSMGSKGVLLFSDNSAYFAEAPKVNVKGTVGAGDTMVAVFAHNIDLGISPESCLPLAVSASSACVEAGGTGELDAVSIHKYEAAIKVMKL